MIEKPSLKSVLLSGTPEVLAGFVVVLVLPFFLLASGDTVHRKVVSSFSKLQDKSGLYPLFEVLSGIYRII